MYYFPDKLSEFSIFLAWPAILDIYSHGVLKIADESRNDTEIALSLHRHCYSFFY